MNNRWIYSAAGALTLAIIGTAFWFYWPVYRAEQQVRSALKDPDSASFHQVKFYRATGGSCGLVNAKNSMGGYAGLTEFIALPSGEVEFAPPSEDVHQSLETRLEANRNTIAFLRRAVAACPEEPSAQSGKTP